MHIQLYTLSTLTIVNNHQYPSFHHQILFSPAANNYLYFSLLPLMTIRPSSCHQQPSILFPHTINDCQCLFSPAANDYQYFSLLPLTTIKLYPATNNHQYSSLPLLTIVNTLLSCHQHPSMLFSPATRTLPTPQFIFLSL